MGSSLLGFQSDATDATSGRVDTGVRAYEPSLGRFGSPDLLFGELTDPITLNRYLYGGASPITYADPTGLRPQCLNCTRQEEQEIVANWAQAQTEAAQEGTGAYSPADAPDLPPASPSPSVIALPTASPGPPVPLSADDGSLSFAEAIAATAYVLTGCVSGAAAAGEIGVHASPLIGGIAAGVGCFFGGAAAGETVQEYIERKAR